MTIPRIRLVPAVVLLWVGSFWCSAFSETIPLPEHPRPDFERQGWQNLNGPWQFQFDKEDAGLGAKWFEQKDKRFDQNIIVPFPWGSPLSQVEDKSPIAWYARSLRLPDGWEQQRVFLVIGACDWETQAWLDGHPLGKHQGGYVPFEFELTGLLTPGQDHRLVLRVDDATRAFKLEGKQGYGNARGIWQTVYLESRPQRFLRQVHFLPDIDSGKVTIRAMLDAAASA
ncbi:MAG TPA: glycoside hydrolase family 2, partial [Verrucomicrobiae bacterium]|nr:glycoside hydrolase family 2 [Verrucomicrobiae bacterium]